MTHNLTHIVEDSRTKHPRVWIAAIPGAQRPQTSQTFDETHNLNYNLGLLGRSAGLIDPVSNLPASHSSSVSQRYPSTLAGLTGLAGLSGTLTVLTTLVTTRRPRWRSRRWLHRVRYSPSGTEPWCSSRAAIISARMRRSSVIVGLR